MNLFQNVVDWFKGLFHKAAATVATPTVTAAPAPEPAVTPPSAPAAPALATQASPTQVFSSSKGTKLVYAGPFLDVKNVTIDDSKYIAKHAAGGFNTIVTGDQAAKNALINAAGQGGDRPATPGDTQPGVVSGNFDDSNYQNAAVQAAVAAYTAFKRSTRTK